MRRRFGGTGRSGRTVNKFFDVQSPMFKPLWLRVLIVGFCAVWTVFELVGSNVFWAILFGAATVFLGYQFFVVFDPVAPDRDDEKQP
ncbi:MAG: hypothetical protein LJE68_15470 [Rhodobacter sp.]|nr:hypothetical protein [Rhodobacter sp.]